MTAAKTRPIGWINTRDAAKYLGVGEDKIRDAANAGDLRARRTSPSPTAPMRHCADWLDEYAERAWPEV